MIRICLYMRYSTDLQNDKSNQDQHAAHNRQARAAVRSLQHQPARQTADDEDPVRFLGSGDRGLRREEGGRWGKRERVRGGGRERLQGLGIRVQAGGDRRGDRREDAGDHEQALQRPLRHAPVRRLRRISE